MQDRLLLGYFIKARNPVESFESKFFSFLLIKELTLTLDLVPRRGRVVLGLRVYRIGLDTWVCGLDLHLVV